MHSNAFNCNFIDLALLIGAARHENQHNHASNHDEDGDNNDGVDDRPTVARPEKTAVAA